jgi:hypothetical protein
MGNIRNRLDDPAGAAREFEKARELYVLSLRNNWPPDPIALDQYRTLNPYDSEPVPVHEHTISASTNTVFADVTPDDLRTAGIAFQASDAPLRIVAGGELTEPVYGGKYTTVLFVEQKRGTGWNPASPKIRGRTALEHLKALNKTSSGKYSELQWYVDEILDGFEESTAYRDG